MKIIVTCIFVLSLLQTVLAQADFKDPYCFQHSGSEGIGLIDRMYPSHLFKTEEIKGYLRQYPETPFSQFFELHMYNYYKPNEKYFSLYTDLLQSNEGYKSLTFTEKGSILSADVVIKGKVIDFSDYNDKCLFYKSTYRIEILEIFKNNFDFRVGDTVTLKSVVGYEGGCAPPEWPAVDSLFSAPTHYESRLEPGTTAMFGLSALWYYKVAVRNAVEQSKFEDTPCFAHFVDPGFLLIGASGKSEDIREFIKSIEP